MNLQPIRDYIGDNTDMTVGEDLFTFSMPPQVKEGVIVVTETAGQHVDHYMPGIFKGRYQIISRSPDYDAAYDRAQELFDLLNMREVDLGDYVVTYSMPRHTPMPYRRSEGDLVECSVNFNIR